MNDSREQEEILVTWDEAGRYHRVRGTLKAEDAVFLTIRLQDGTELRIGKRALLKVERPGKPLLLSGSPRGGLLDRRGEEP